MKCKICVFTQNTNCVTLNVLIILDIYDVTCFSVEKNFQALVTFEKYETTNYDVGRMRSYSRNILQYKTKSMKMTQWRLLGVEEFLNLRRGE